MGRPRKENAQAAEIEMRDTLYWCGLAKAFSGLSDAEIEHRVFNLAGLNSIQISTRLKSVSMPSGRNFNRWLNGKRAMNHDMIQRFVKNARKVGVLPKSRTFSLIEDAEEKRAIDALICSMKSSQEKRAVPDNHESAKSRLKTTLESIKELHVAKRELNEAALKFQKCATKAATNGVGILDDNSIEGRDGIIEIKHIIMKNDELKLIAERVREICNLYYFDEKIHDLS